MPSSSTFGLLLLYFFLMLPPKCSLQESSTTSASPAPESSLPKCRNYQQACAVELIRFPTLDEPTTTAEPTTTTAVAATRTSTEQQRQQQSAIGIGTTTSGGEVQLEGSGEEEELPPVDVDADEPPIQFVPIGARFPLYDEFVPTTPVYDYAAEPVDRQQQQICACPEEEQCGGDTGDEQRTLPFSPQIRASFCKPLDEVFKLKCKGTRTLARVIGTLDAETEDRLSAVNDTLVFCRCESSRWAQVMVEPWINNAFAFSYKCIEK